MGRHGDAEVSTLPASVGAQSPHLHLAGTVPRGKAQSGTSRARACLGLTGPRSVTQAAPPSSAPARVVGVGHKQEVGGCALSDKHQGRQAPSSAQSAGLRLDRGHRARVNTPSSPRLSKTHPGQGLGEVSSLLRRGRGAALTVSEVVLTPKHT